MDQKSHTCFEVGQFFPASKSGSRFIRFIKLYFAIKQSPLRKNVDVTITLKTLPIQFWPSEAENITYTP